MNLRILFLGVFLSAFLVESVLAESYEEVDQNLRNYREQAAREGWTFSVGTSSILEQSHEFRTGFKQPKNWKELAPFSKTKAYVTEPLPSHWDWREHGGVSPIKNQRSCGSCWAFGTVASMESAVLIATGQKLNLSEQQLVSCSPSYGSCSGGYYAFGFYKQKGANYTTDFPYSASDVSCKSGVTEHEKLMSWSYVGEEDGEPSIEDLKAAVFKFGVLAVTVAAGGQFSYYKEGIYNACSRGMTDHIVALVGWDDETQTWLVKNSWGEDWGEDGYIRMKWNDASGKKCNRIAETAAYGVYTPPQQ